MASHFAPNKIEEAQNYANSLNKTLLRVEATEDARNQLMKSKMKLLKEAFPYIDPYVQCVILQSVIYLNKNQFNDIKNDYFLLIESVKNSSDEWVRRKAFEFSEYPTIQTDQDINESFDMSAFINYESKNQSNNNDGGGDDDDHFDVSQIEKLFPDITPPSANIKKREIKRRPEQTNKEQNINRARNISIGLSIPQQQDVSLSQPTYSTSQPKSHEKKKGKIFGDFPPDPPKKEKKKKKIMQDFNF